MLVFVKFTYAFTHIFVGCSLRLCSPLDCFSSIPRSKEITCAGDFTELAIGLVVNTKGFNCPSCYWSACVAILVGDSFLCGEGLYCADGSEAPNAANLLPSIYFFYSVFRSVAFTEREWKVRPSDYRFLGEFIPMTSLATEMLIEAFLGRYCLCWPPRLC